MLQEVEARPSRGVHPTFFRLGDIRPAHCFLRILGGLSCPFWVPSGVGFAMANQTREARGGRGRPKARSVWSGSSSLAACGCLAGQLGPACGGALSTSSAAWCSFWPSVAVVTGKRKCRQAGLVMQPLSQRTDPTKKKHATALRPLACADMPPSRSSP